MTPPRLLKSPLFLLTLCLWTMARPSVARAEEPRPLTLSEAVAAALRQSPVLGVAQARLEGARHSLGEARAERWPRLSFSQSLTQSNNPVEVFGQRLEQGRFGPGNFGLDELNNPGALTNLRSRVNLAIPVFNHLQRLTHIRRATLAGEERALELERTRQLVRYRVIEAYYAVLLAEARRRVAQEAVRQAQEEARRLGDLYQQGTVVLSDRLAMEVQLAEFRQQLIRAKGAVRTARQRLALVLGQEERVMGPLTSPLEAKDFPLPAEEAALAAAIENRPDLAAARAEEKRARQQLRGARGERLPDLDLFAEFGSSSQGVTTGSADFTVGASLNFRLFDPGRSHRVGRALSRIEAARRRVDQKRLAVRLEVVEALERERAARQQVEVAGSAVGQAEETGRIVRERHQAGLVTITEVLRAQTALVRARMNLLAARFEQYRSFAALLLAQGRLRDVQSFE